MPVRRKWSCVSPEMSTCSGSGGPPKAPPRREEAEEDGARAGLAGRRGQGGGGGRGGALLSPSPSPSAAAGAGPGVPRRRSGIKRRRRRRGALLLGLMLRRWQRGDAPRFHIRNGGFVLHILLRTRTEGQDPLSLFEWAGPPPPPPPVTARGVTPRP